MILNYDIFLKVGNFSNFFRPFGVGLCSGIGRLGAILGLILGEYKKLHLINPAMIVIGVLTFISAVLVNLLPDLTKKIMPKNLTDIEQQIFYSSNSNVNHNNKSNQNIDT